MKLLTQKREDKGWSRSELARRAIMSAASVGQIENGRLLPYDSQLEKIARALGYQGDPAELMEEVGQS